jgi:DNA-binding MurR/RpiR family transcriptional regulator
MSADRLIRDHAPPPIAEALDRLLDYAIDEMRQTANRETKAALADVCREIQKLRSRLAAA